MEIERKQRLTKQEQSRKENFSDERNPVNSYQHTGYVYSKNATSLEVRLLCSLSMVNQGRISKNKAAKRQDCNRGGGPTGPGKECRFYFIYR